MISQLNPLTPFRAVQVGTTGKEGGEDMEKREKGNRESDTALSPSESVPLCAGK